MSEILDLIKRSAVPSAVLRTASKGALPLPAAEMIEILVYLTHNPVFSQDAKMTLASWDVESATAVVKESGSPPEVLGYFWSEENRRPALMPALIENPSIPEELLMELAGTASREIVSVLLASPRVRSSPAVIEALTTNFRLMPDELKELTGASPAAVAAEASGGEAHEEPAAEVDPETEAAHRAWQQEHAEEIAAEEGKPFELTGEDEAEAPAAKVAHDQPAAEEAAAQQPAVEQAAAGEAAQEQPETEKSAADTAMEPAPKDKAVQQGGQISQSFAVTALAAANRAARAPSADEKRLTIMQRLARMNASERVKAAFAGNKEERAILIRDGARVVQNAVLASPKLTDPEVETFAAAKNVNENVLREIARNRRFMKHYPVMRNLVLNPKTPLDIALPLVKMLMVYDLKGLQHSKSVSDTIRKVAQKYYKEKATSGGKTKE